MTSLPYVIQSEAKDLENTPRLSKALFTHPFPPLYRGVPSGRPPLSRGANEAFRGKTKCLSVPREGSQVLLATEVGCVRTHKAEKKS